MRPRLLGILVLAAASSLAFEAPANAQSQTSIRGGMRATGSDHVSIYRRRAPQVRGYVARRGGYSYTVQDAINTYGDSRSLYGGASVYRDPMLDRQTVSGPFDHGFFFDSGINPRGGDSPYQN